MLTLLPLMIVPLLVWISVWAYLWTLDNKVKTLQRELAQWDGREETER